MHDGLLPIIVLIVPLVWVGVWWLRSANARWRRTAAGTAEAVDAARQALCNLEDELISNVVIVAVEQLQVTLNDFERRWRGRG